MALHWSNAERRLQPVSQLEGASLRGDSGNVGVRTSNPILYEGRSPGVRNERHLHPGHVHLSATDVVHTIDGT